MSPQGGGGGGGPQQVMGNFPTTLPAPHQGKPPPKNPTQLNSFQQFKKQAQEKADRQRLLQEQQEKRKRQSEQAERERQRVEQERRQQREEEDALERARRAMKPEPLPPAAMAIK